MVEAGANVHRLHQDDGTKSYRLAPHNIEAEQALLGAILVNNEAFYRVSDFLVPIKLCLTTHGARGVEAEGHNCDRPMKRWRRLCD